MLFARPLGYVDVDVTCDSMSEIDDVTSKSYICVHVDLNTATISCKRDGCKHRRGKTMANGEIASHHIGNTKNEEPALLTPPHCPALRCKHGHGH